MNGDLNLEGKRLFKEYSKMISEAGFKIPMPESNTDRFIKKDVTGLTTEETFVLFRFNPNNTVSAQDAMNEYQRLLKFRSRVDRNK